MLEDLALTQEDLVVEDQVLPQLKSTTFGGLCTALSLSQNGFHLHPPTTQNLLLCINEHPQMTSHKEGEGGWSFCDIST